jgi:DNA-binding NtrC family response regulator
MPVEPLAGCRVLLVEDSMIVAPDGEDALRELGASEVRVASTVDGAMTAVRQGTLDFAILDFNLGDETSLDVAQALLDRHVPFLFATGYGESLGLSPTFDAIGIITKPYNLRSLAVPIAAARLAETTKYPMAHADADPTAVPSPVHPCR